MHVSRRDFLKGVGAAGTVLALSKLPLGVIEPLESPKAGAIAHELFRVHHFTNPVPVSEELLTDGGFLVPTEYMVDLMALMEDELMMRMPSRRIRIPRLRS